MLWSGQSCTYPGERPHLKDEAQSSCFIATHLPRGLLRMLPPLAQPRGCSWHSGGLPLWPRLAATLPWTPRKPLEPHQHVYFGVPGATRTKDCGGAQFESALGLRFSWTWPEKYCLPSLLRPRPEFRSLGTCPCPLPQEWAPRTVGCIQWLSSPREGRAGGEAGVACFLDSARLTLHPLTP